MIRTEAAGGVDNPKNYKRISVRWQLMSIPMHSRQTDFVDLSAEVLVVRAILSLYGWTEISATNMLSFRKGGQRMSIW